MGFFKKTFHKARNVGRSAVNVGQGAVNAVDDGLNEASKLAIAGMLL